MPPRKIETDAGVRGTLAVDTMAAHLKGEAETERVNVGHTLIFKE